ncbi:MAG: hypothetical protein AMXMBFR34_26610 [Myxococcaceae bacterium]
MSIPLLSARALERALAVRDLTDPAQGPHALQLLLRDVVEALRTRWRADLHLHRAGPVVSVADNYDALGYPPDGAARDARYTRYVSPAQVLRTQTSALVPPLLRGLAAESGDDVLLVCPGLVYRRDCIDRLHTGTPHQVDLWRVTRGALGGAALDEMAALVLEAALPGRAWRSTPARHPYTVEGLQLDARDGDGWTEVGECGLAHPELLGRCGLSGRSGLAMGLGLDRLLMLRKGLPDIRLLRSEEPRGQAQLLDLSAWRPVSRQPKVVRDLSLAVDGAEDVSAEALGDRVREALGARAEWVEAVEVLSRVPGAAVPPVAAERLGLEAGQDNVLVRVVLRAVDRALTSEEANGLRDEVYAALHRGTRWTWAGRR